jgi:hypothetical protein
MDTTRSEKQLNEKYFIMRKSIISSCLLFALLILSCTPKGTPVTAGKGGKASIIASVAHHDLERFIFNCKIYIKYNTLDMPSDGNFDDSAVCGPYLSDTIQTVVFNNLQNGNYYLYANGQDSLWVWWVKGGLPVTITQQLSQPYTVTIPISEYKQY